MWPWCKLRYLEKELRWLKDRVEHLENEVNRRTAISYPKYPGSVAMFDYTREVSVSELCGKILEHLGLTLKYAGGTPERDELVKREGPKLSVPTKAAAKKKRARK